jgi:hypothetical protein
MEGNRPGDSIEALPVQRAVSATTLDQGTLLSGGVQPMSPDDLDADNGSTHHNEHDHDHDHDHEHEHEGEHEHEVEEALEEALELDTQSQIFLELRRQNLDLLRIATQVVGYTGQHGPLKPGDAKSALRALWDVYAEFYRWVDPEETEEDEEDDDE